MRNSLFILSVFALGACGGGGTGNAGVSPAATSGFARATDDILNVGQGTVFTFKADKANLFGSQEIVVIEPQQSLSSRYITDRRIEITLDGTPYRLDLNPITDEYEGSGNNLDLTASLNTRGRYAGTLTVRSDDKATTDASVDNIYYGVVGYSTNPSALPSIANYRGKTRVLMQTSASGDLLEGTVTLAADFAGGTLSGKMTLDDPAGDGGDGIDLQNLTIGLENGTINANSFSADMVFTQSELTAGGVQSVLPMSMNGGFFGPTGENAVGAALGVGKTVSSGGTDDLLIRAYIEGNKL